MLKYLLIKILIFAVQHFTQLSCYQSVNDPLYLVLKYDAEEHHSCIE